MGGGKKASVKRNCEKDFPQRFALLSLLFSSLFGVRMKIYVARGPVASGKQLQP